MTNTVLDKIINNQRMPVLFIGSGVSKRYLFKYPDWKELIEMSYSKVDPDPFFLQKYLDQLNRQSLSDFEINTKLGTIIENEFNRSFYERKITLKIGSPKNPSWVKRGISPYKMFLADYFKKMRLNRNPHLLKEIEQFKLLKNKITAVITTNYDLFLEQVVFSSDYHVFVHQNELFSCDSYNIAEIYKIHGSVTDADSIMITEKDYSEFNDTRKLIIAKMLTLFAEAPIIFLGYSFTDENIQLIISEFLSCLSPKELVNIDEHFIFISYKKNEENLLEIKRTITTKNGIQIPITEIQTDNYYKVFETLNQITPGISPIRVRETRKVVKNIVDHSIISGDADSIIVGIDDLSKIDYANKPLAIAIGYKENILNKFGYGLLSDDMIFEDILFDNKHFDANEMCINRFKSISYTRLLPVFKYVKNATVCIDTNSKLKNYISLHNTPDKLFPGNIQKQVKTLPQIDNYNSLIVEMEKVDSINKKSGLLLKNITHYSIEQIRNICSEFFKIDRESAMLSTHFKRCVMYIDLEENYKKKS